MKDNSGNDNNKTKKSARWWKQNDEHGGGRDDIHISDGKNANKNLKQWTQMEE